MSISFAQSDVLFRQDRSDRPAFEPSLPIAPIRYRKREDRQHCGLPLRRHTRGFPRLGEMPLPRQLAALIALSQGCGDARPPTLLFEDNGPPIATSASFAARANRFC